jgi:hypothetical protein
MSAVLAPSLSPRSPFDLDDAAAYAAWRARKLADRPRDLAALTVDVQDPRAPTDAECQALLDRCARFNLGLARLDANWLADEDGISQHRGGRRRAGRGEFIPYTDRAIRWHTDGYYHPQARRIRGMMLHCVRPAAQGGENRLLDPNWPTSRCATPTRRWIRALMRPTR